MHLRDDALIISDLHFYGKLAQKDLNTSYFVLSDQFDRTRTGSPSKEFKKVFRFNWTFGISEVRFRHVQKLVYSL